MGVQHLSPWKPGQSGNPSGRPKLPEALRAIRSLTQIEVTKLVSKYAQMLPDELDSVLEARSAPMIEMAIAQIFAQSAKYGDYQRLAFLLDRSVGKLPVADMSDDDMDARRELQQLTNEELKQRVLAVLPTLETT